VFVRLFVVVLLLLASPALAQDWRRYENPQYGFGLELPPGYSGNAGVFRSEDGAEVLKVSGGAVQPGSFDEFWEKTQSDYEAAGWSLRYEPVAPHWTTFTGERNGQALFVKMMPLCGGTKQFGMISLEYPADDPTTLERIAFRVADSMTRTGTGFSC
jgi:hypothetical protein